MRSLLASPRAYRLFTQVIGGGRSRFVQDYVRPLPADRVLDVGCGPGDILDHLPAVEYVGVDMHPAYVEAARSRYGDRGRFLIRRVGHDSLDDLPAFDIVMARGLVHHLDDREARSFFEGARAALKPGGRLVTLDGCYVDPQSALVRLIIGMDRGGFVRDEAGYLKLSSATFSDVQTSILHDLIRIPYTHIIMECTR